MAVLTDIKARNIKPESTALPHGGVVGLSLLPTKAMGNGYFDMLVQPLVSVVMPD